MTEQLQIKSLKTQMQANKTARHLIDKLRCCGWAGAVADYASKMEETVIKRYGMRTHEANEYAKACDCFAKLQAFGLNLIPQVADSLFIADPEACAFFWRLLSNHTVINYDLTTLSPDDDRSRCYVAETAEYAFLGLRLFAYACSNSWMDKGTGKQIREYFDALAEPLTKCCAFLNSQIEDPKLRDVRHKRHADFLAMTNESFKPCDQLPPFDGLYSAQ